MKFIQTLYFSKSVNPFKNSFGWAAPEYHLMGWALSCLQLLRLYKNVDLYCNSKVASLLKNELELPYSNIYVTHDDLNIVNEKLWALPKVFTYSLQDEPFLHVDGDVFLFKELPVSLLKGGLIAQNVEEATTFDYPLGLQKELMKYFTYFPNCVKKDFNSKSPIKSINAGILGGNNILFIKEYANMAFEYINRNSSHLSSINVDRFNLFYEQHLFFSLANEKGLLIEFLLEDIIMNNRYQHLGDFHEVPCKKSYLHLLGNLANSKKDEYTCRQMAAKLRQLYPEYYYKIISLCKKKFASLRVSFYSDTRFNTINDYIHFNKKAKEIYSNSSYANIPKTIDDISRTTFQTSEVNVLTLLKKQLDQMSSLNSITSEARKDFREFLKNIRQVLMLNKRISNVYLYGRDLESVNWFCELFGNDLNIPDKVISKCKEIKIIQSKFDWGGLVNKITRIGIEYYEVLELESGEFYNLVIPEIFVDGFSIQDLDEMEKIILDNLSQPLLIKDLFAKMHIYAEDDIITNHLDEYEHLIIVMLKQLVLKKAIKPFKKNNYLHKIAKLIPSL